METFVARRFHLFPPCSNYRGSTVERNNDIKKPSYYAVRLYRKPVAVVARASRGRGRKTDLPNPIYDSTVSGETAAYSFATKGDPWFYAGRLNAASLRIKADKLARCGNMSRIWESSVVCHFWNNLRLTTNLPLSRGKREHSYNAERKTLRVKSMVWKNRYHYLSVDGFII